jgi:hypothetical protein
VCVCVSVSKTTLVGQSLVVSSCCVGRLVEAVLSASPEAVLHDEGHEGEEEADDEGDAHVGRLLGEGRLDAADAVLGGRPVHHVLEEPEDAGGAHATAREVLLEGAQQVYHVARDLLHVVVLSLTGGSVLDEVIAIIECIIGGVVGGCQVEGDQVGARRSSYVSSPVEDFRPSLITPLGAVKSAWAGTICLGAHVGARSVSHCHVNVLNCP